VITRYEARLLTAATRCSFDGAHREVVRALSPAKVTEFSEFQRKKPVKADGGKPVHFADLLKPDASKQDQH